MRVIIASQQVINSKSRITSLTLIKKQNVARSIDRSNYSIFAFNVSDISSYSVTLNRFRMNSNRQINSFSTRLVNRSFINNSISTKMLKDWTAFVELILNSLIFNEANKHKMLCLFHRYRHLNDIDLTNLSCTNLFIHKVRIKFDTKSTNIIIQKRWSTHIEWWLRKIITNDMKERIYELIESTNNFLSRWNVRIVIMNKIENSTSEHESRVIFDYSRVNEKLSDSHLELFNKIHDNLSNSRHRCLFATNLKHVYFTISFHFDDKHYFFFTIFDID